MDNKLSEEQIKEKQQEYLKLAIEEGSTFEDMVKHNGWKMILSNYQNQLRTFINDLMLNDKPIQDYEFKRRELMGLQKLITSIDNSIKTAVNEREKPKGSTVK